MTPRVVDALLLRIGDRILVGPGRVERVRKPSKRRGRVVVVIYTDEHDIVTTLPCRVKVMRDAR